MQGSGWRGSHWRSPERLFREPTETKKPQKMHLQGSEGTSTDGGWLDGVRQGWRWKRVGGKCSTRRRVRFRSLEKKRTWPARGWESPSSALTKLEDLLLAHLMVWSVSEKDLAGKKSPEKSSAVRVFWRWYGWSESFRRWERWPEWNTATERFPRIDSRINRK